jgi:hypothetical protein
VFSNFHEGICSIWLEPTAAHINICTIFFLERMIDPRIFVMMLTVAAASIGLVTVGLQSTMAQPLALDVDVEEDVEAGNATTTMMTNQTAVGNMTGGTNSTS